MQRRRREHARVLSWDPERTRVCVPTTRTQASGRAGNNLQHVFHVHEVKDAEHDARLKVAHGDGRRPGKGHKRCACCGGFAQKSATVAIDRRPCPRYTDCGHNSPCPQSRHLPLDGQGFRRPRLRFRRPCRSCPESYLSPPSPRAWARSLKRSLSPTLQSAQDKVESPWSKARRRRHKTCYLFFCFPQFPHFGLLLSPFLLLSFS